ncbi:MAG TPA: Gfo/Idh/MocA family oxidoreductase [Acidimicrobiales bacterium]|nr:Gfo/Idh/MocA family oxidoreductase [Acidimicrobiales bacterium]
MAPLGLGFIGCGVIAHAHAFSLAALAQAGLCDVEIAAAHDSDAGRSQRFAQTFGGRAVASADELADAVDAVYVCTSTAAHLDGIRAAARAGKPAFCEKPLARDLAETEELIALATVPVQVGLVLRTAPVFLALADLVRGGELGRPMACTWRDDQFFPIQGHYGSKWRSDPNVAGSGALLEHTIHDVDIIATCFGRVEAVSSTSATHFGHPGIEDSASALLMTESGLTVSLVTVWHEVMSRPSSRRVETIFERGLVTFEDDFAGPLTIQTSEGVEVRACPPPAWVDDVPLPEGRIGLAIRPYVEENRNFVAGVSGKGPLSPTLADALVAHRVVDACYRSAAGGGVLTAVGDQMGGPAGAAP